MNAEKVNELAKETGFMKRTRKIAAYDLIESVLFNMFETDKLSLNDHSSYLLVNKGIIVSKQSLDERFNEKSVVFIKKLLEEALSENLYRKDNFPVLNGFSKIRIKDAVNFQLPEHLKSVYPGSGGAASKAMIKIQFEFDLLTRQILELEICPFTKTDSVNAQDTVEKIQPGELVIRDLGYISIKNMKTISRERGGYFLNRLKSSVIVYQENINGAHQVDFEKLEKKMRKYNIEAQETMAYVGEEDKFPVRMVVRLVPEKVKQERIREKKKYAKKKKQEINKETLARCGVNVYITNACEDLLPIGTIAPIYGIRWQVENVFKVWKSIGGIDKVKKISKERFEFYLFSKLIFLIKSWRIMRLIENATNLAISYYKFVKVATISGYDRIDKMIEVIAKTTKAKQCIEKEFRKNRINEKSIKTILNTCISVI